MNSIDLEFILVLLIIISFILILISKKNIGQNSSSLKWIIIQAKSFLPILIIVLFLRSFLAEPFRIPSGSMLPTLLIGDYILVNKYEYGIRLPLTKSKVINIAEPERGDVVVFRYPGNEKINFIKRVIGLPGDHIRYEDKNLYVNNIRYEKTTQNNHAYESEFLRSEIEIFLEENNKNKSYYILNDNMSPTNDDYFIVPKGKYFVMGDNRDHSSDSRYWGFVPDENLVGKAFFIWMNFDSNNYSLKYKRIGNSIE